MYHLGNGITAVVVSSNLILRYVAVVFVEWVSLKELDTSDIFILHLLWITQYLNSGLSFLIIFINTEQSGVYIPFLDGKYPDYIDRWYLEIAPYFVIPMFVIILVPFIELFANFLIQKFMMWKDRGWTWASSLRTNCHTVGQYVDMVSGCQNTLYDRYSNVIVLLLVNLLYGVGLPMLFPLTLFSLLSLYFVEKWLTVDYY